MISNELYMNYIVGESREQTILFPVSIDEFISDDNLVRFIDAFVDQLDMKEYGFKNAKLNSTGRPPYMPSDMMKLYIYSYHNSIRSSRKIEKECHRNVELMWLMKKLTPDHKTISNFRKDNKKSIIAVNKSFILMCKNMGLIADNELFAVDGSKFAAVNANKRNYTKNKLIKIKEKIEKEIERYLSQMDNNDKDEQKAPVLFPHNVNAALKKLQEQNAKCNSLLEYLEQSGETQVSLTDPDSKMMKDQQKPDVCYNGEICTSENNKIIVACEPTSDINDLKQLYPMAEQIKENLGLEVIDIVGDKGFFSKEAIKKCEESNINCYIPEPLKSSNKKKGMFTDKDFKYNPSKDEYECPSGDILTFKSIVKKHDMYMKLYQTSACKDCPLKSKCTTSKSVRSIYRWVDEDFIERMRQRVTKRPDIIAKRKAMVEHPFGTMKRTMNFTYFLTKGKENVRSEFNLWVLIYNMKRVLNIFGFKRAMEMMMSLPKTSFINGLKSALKHIFLMFYRQNSYIFA